jgi:cobalamin biosynthesis protein CobT
MCYSGKNRDGEMLIWARQRLLAQKAGKHIMTVISDGQPRSSSKGDIAGLTYEVIRSIEQEGRIDLYALGLENRSVLQFYKHAAMVDDASQLEDKLLTVLRDKIIPNAR